MYSSGVLCAALVSFAFVFPSLLAFVGRATFYDGAGNKGSCKQNYRPMGYQTVAMNSLQYKNSLSCGSCIEGCMKRPYDTFCFKAIVDNECTECSFGDLRMAMFIDDEYDVEWNYIACPSIDPFISIQYATSYYGKMKIEGGGPIIAVEVNGISASSTSDAFWLINDINGTLGCGVKLTIIFASGQRIEKCVPGNLFGGECSSKKKCLVTSYVDYSAAVNLFNKIAGTACINGIPHADGVACCPKSCTQCGGNNCSKLPGGASNCCSSQIVRNEQRSCTINPAPCVMP